MIALLPSAMIEGHLCFSVNDLWTPIWKLQERASAHQKCRSSSSPRLPTRSLFDQEKFSFFHKQTVGDTQNDRQGTSGYSWRTFGDVILVLWDVGGGVAGTTATLPSWW